MDREIWKRIQDFTTYSVSNFGSIYNERTGRIMRASHTWQGHVKISLLSDSGTRHTVSVAHLVAYAFVEPPNDYSNQVVILDGDLNNLAADNLVWRTRRFSRMYFRQIHEPQPIHYKNLRVHNITHNRYYRSVIETGQTEGLLFEEIWISTYTGKIVYPIEAAFEVVK